jgi:hypothetical protein
MAVTDNGYVVKMTAPGDYVTGGRHIGFIRWVNATTKDHGCLLKDGAGHEIFYSVADGPNFIDILPLFRIIDGLVLTTCDSGTLYAYIR